MSRPALYFEGGARHILTLPSSCGAADFYLLLYPCCLKNFWNLTMDNFIDAIQKRSQKKSWSQVKNKKNK